MLLVIKYCYIILDCNIILYYYYFFKLQIISSQSPISLDDVELVIEGDIENDDYITNAM